MKHVPAPPSGSTAPGRRARLVIVPGLHGSGDAHWQSWLHGQVEGAVRVEQDFWSEPDIERWADRVAETVDALAPGPRVLVAHSFGCLAALHANALPQGRLPMPTCLVASDNDPWMSATQAHAWAQRWGSDWINLGNAGHINTDSGYGPFPLAREWATAALVRLERQPWRAAA